ncbi:MAG: ROK family protein [Clostridia bacterium]|nr:ROK family protein [Clostridia bacterium]
MDALLAVGIDLGGTNVRVGVVDEEGRVLAFLKAPSAAAEGPEAALRRAATLARSLPAPAAVAAAGLAMPGPLDLRQGIVLSSPNLAGWDGFAVAAHLSSLLELPVRLVRDAPAALLGEHWRGAARDCRHVVLLTLGTGVGGAALVNGELLLGRDGHAGEFGHITVDPEGPLCGCGNRGCLEAMASGRALERDAGAPAAVVFAAARRGEGWATAAVARYAEALGTGVAGLVNAFNPERVVLTGGVVAGRDAFWSAMEDAVRRRAFRPATTGLSVVPGRLGDRAGVVGAARAALSRLQEDGTSCSEIHRKTGG